MKLLRFTAVVVIAVSGLWGAWTLLDVQSSRIGNAVVCSACLVTQSSESLPQTCEPCSYGGQCCDYKLFDKYLNPPCTDSESNKICFATDQTIEWYVDAACDPSYAPDCKNTTTPVVDGRGCYDTIPPSGCE